VTARHPVKLDPQGPFKRDPPPPHRLRDRLTPTHDVVVLCHLGVPRSERDQWTLTIDGLVERALTLRLDDLARYPRTEITSVHQCCGSPLARYVRTGEAAAWLRAELEPVRGREWQRFSVRWVPRRRGAVVLAALAEAMNGALQPTGGRRNAIHGVPVTVT
jgi:DMSO/TMAO reductase YedYZ molybdopterin-dependent catalytic subunit